MRPPRLMIAAGNFFFRTRDFIYPVVFIVLALGFTPNYPAGSESLDFCLDFFGVCVALGGQALRAAVIGYAYVKRGGKDKMIYAERLVQEGFFAHSRNPLYLGNLLVLLGLAIIHNSPWVYLCGGMFYGFAYLSITFAEEEFLRGKFGDEYVVYCGRVNRFVPSFRGLHSSISGMNFDWQRVVRKEYGSTFTWLLTAIVLLVWERVAHAGYHPHSLQIKALIFCVIPLLMLYGLARYLKKARFLGSD